jgi:hypothetical protein
VRERAQFGRRQECSTDVLGELGEGGLRLLEPERHVHGVTQGNGVGEGRAGCLPLPTAAIEHPQFQEALRQQRPHAKRCGQYDGLTLGGVRRRRRRRRLVCGKRRQEPQYVCLDAALPGTARACERFLRQGESLGPTAIAPIPLAKGG